MSGQRTDERSEIRREVRHQTSGQRSDERAEIRRAFRDQTSNHRSDERSEIRRAGRDQTSGQRSDERSENRRAIRDQMRGQRSDERSETARLIPYLDLVEEDLVPDAVAADHATLHLQPFPLGGEVQQPALQRGVGLTEDLRDTDRTCV